MRPDNKPDGTGLTRRAFMTYGTALAAIIAAHGSAVEARPWAGRLHPPRCTQPEVKRWPSSASSGTGSIPISGRAFHEYAARWGQIIPRCGASLIGYFLPRQGTNYVGWGLIGGFDSLCAYERYQERLHQDPEARDNLKFAQERRFIVHEERNFVEVVAGTFELPAPA